MFSALPLRADIAQCSRHVRFVPIAEVTASFDYLVAGRRDQVDHERAVERGRQGDGDGPADRDWMRARVA
jgi:hypothetical protein